MTKRLSTAVVFFAAANFALAGLVQLSLPYSVPLVQYYSSPLTLSAGVVRLANPNSYGNNNYRYALGGQPIYTVDPRFPNELMHAPPQLTLDGPGQVVGQPVVSPVAPVSLPVANPNPNPTPSPVQGPAPIQVAEQQPVGQPGSVDEDDTLVVEGVGSIARGQGAF